MILQLLLQREVVELAAEGELTIDFFLRNAKVLDVEETDVLGGVGELVDQLLFAAGLFELAEVEGDEFGPVD